VKVGTPQIAAMMTTNLSPSICGLKNSFGSRDPGQLDQKFQAV
jgi:hypothetical protein